jgi:glycerol uptake facilitator-like aquaporin
MWQARCAEFFGTAELLTEVVGSGIMSERLAGGHVAIALLVNALATGYGPYVLISVFGSISGAHFNLPVSVMVEAFRGRLQPNCCRHTADRCGIISGGTIVRCSAGLGRCGSRRVRPAETSCLKWRVRLVRATY